MGYPLDQTPVESLPSGPDTMRRHSRKPAIEKNNLHTHTQEIQFLIGFEERTGADRKSIMVLQEKYCTSMVRWPPPASATPPCWEATWAGQQSVHTASWHRLQNVLAVQGTEKSVSINACRVSINSCRYSMSMARRTKRQTRELMQAAEVPASRLLLTGLKT